MAKLERSLSEYGELFFSSIHLSLDEARVPAHAISLMTRGFASTYASIVEVAAFPPASYAATDIVVDALAERESAAPVPVVVAMIVP